MKAFTPALCLSLLILLLPTTALAKPAWKKFNTEDGITCFKQEVKGSDLIAFRGETTLKAPLKKVLSVLMDNKRRTEWVDRLKTSTILKKVSAFEYVIYQHFEAPFVISDRDYVYRGKAHRDASGKVYLVMKSCTSKKAPKTVGVRAELMRSAYVLTPKGKNRTHISVEIHTDPKGLIPNWLVNLIQKSWPVKTLNGVRKQLERSDIRSHPLPPLKRIKATTVRASAKKRRRR